MRVTNTGTTTGTQRTGATGVTRRAASGIARRRVAKMAPAKPAAPSAAATREQAQVRREAAKLRLITDQKLGKKTPSWVSKLAGK